MKSLRRCHYELIALILMAGSTTAVFWFTNLDQWAAGLFFHPEVTGDQWSEQHWWLWQALYDYAFPFTITAGILALLVYLVSHIHDDVRSFRCQALYILLVIALVPGVLVNLVAKDHWGRPRPLHTQAFGGEYSWLRVFYPVFSGTKP
jgi:membrane-associated PAP2 superfamily phosphatase